jgi:hypothetical protein
MPRGCPVQGAAVPWICPAAAPGVAVSRPGHLARMVPERHPAAQPVAVLLRRDEAVVRQELVRPRGFAEVTADLIGFFTLSATAFVSGCAARRRCWGGGGAVLVAVDGALVRHGTGGDGHDSITRRPPRPPGRDARGAGPVDAWVLVVMGHSGARARPPSAGVR